MSRLEDLPPDQRAALSLLLRQRKSYADVAGMLQISPQSVYDRAQAALAVLAPREARELEPARRLELGDYLLGQQGSVSERLRTRTYLGGSEPARDWARAVAAELAPLADGQRLPEIPLGSAPAGAGAPPRAPAGATPTPDSAPESPTQQPLAPPSSRLGGALILAAIVVAVAVAVVLLLNDNGNSSSHKKTQGTTKTSTSASKGPAVHQITLKAASPSERQVGVLEVLSEGGKRAFYIEAANLPASHGFFYAIWLYNSPKSAEPLSKAPPVGSSHRLAGGALLPANAGRFKKVLLTREHSTHPTHPGPVVLQGNFSL